MLVRVPWAAEWSEDRRALRLSVIVAIVLHALLVVVRFGAPGRIVVPELVKQIDIVDLARPPVAHGAAGGQTPEPGSIRKPVRMPIPDPTPDAPEPLDDTTVLAIPVLVEQIGSGLLAGDVAAPEGPGGGARGSSGRGERPGGDQGDPRLQASFRAPVPLLQPTPAYTEEARKSRTEGLVVLQAVIRKDGTVAVVRVIRGLGRGLDESAIEAVANRWRFRPGTVDGQPVDVPATIEVSFRLF